jgi:hypothetical protein
MRKNLLATCLLAGALAVAGPAEAQQYYGGGRGMMGPGMMGQGMMSCPMCGDRAGGGMGRMGMMSGQAGHVEGRIAFLKTELKITDVQLPLWNAVADAMREDAKSIEAAPRGAMATMSQPATLPERLAAVENALAARLDSLRKLKTAVDPLYAALSDERKKTADELTTGPMGGGMMGGGMMGGGMMGGGHGRTMDNENRH